MAEDDYRFREYSGGCQCGAVRFHATELKDNPHLCHCRMCQKAMGNLFAALVGVKGEDLTWTRGEAATFRSSEHVDRGFCRDCGTPLAYETKFGLELAIGAFDDPTVAAPVIQVNPHDKLPFFESITSLPLRSDTDEWRDFMAGIHSNQHPDHDTDDWPPKERV